MRLASRTWQTQPWIEIPILEDAGRVYQDHGGRVPYIKDLLNAATRAKEKDDIIVFTNADICVASNCSFVIVAALQSVNAVYCFRRDFHRLDTPLPDPIIRSGAHYVGSDLYAFRVSWWKRWRDTFPDMLLGREAWDAVLRILIDQTHPGLNCTVYDLIYHERHGSTWENPANRRSLPSQLHNVRLARTWLISCGVDPRSIGV